MGAITFCPNFPFHIHSMSSLPILKESLYEGPQIDKLIEHVVFPISLILDDDPEYILLSFGYNDRHGIISKMHISELLQSLVEVSECR